MWWRASRRENGHRAGRTRRPTKRPSPHDWKLWPRHTGIYIISSRDLKRDSVTFIFHLFIYISFFFVFASFSSLSFIIFSFTSVNFYLAVRASVCEFICLSLSSLSVFFPPPSPSLAPFSSRSRSVTLYYLVLCFLPSPAPVQKMECDRERCRFSHSLGCLPVVEGAVSTQTSAIQTDRP